MGKKARDVVAESRIKAYIDRDLRFLAKHLFFKVPKAWKVGDGNPVSMIARCLVYVMADLYCHPRDNEERALCCELKRAFGLTVKEAERPFAERRQIRKVTGGRVA